MEQKEKTHLDAGGWDEEEEEVTLTFKNADGARHEMRVKKGTSVREFLKSLNHKSAKGLVYKLNNRLLRVNEEGELVDDELLEENAVLAIEQQFTGGW